MMNKTDAYRQIAFPFVGTDDLPNIVDNDIHIFYGIFVVLTGAFCFGTMHVPIRRFATEHDAFFVQWVMSFGSLMVGFVVNIAVGSPPMRLMASGGGILWTIGLFVFANTIAQFVISTLGLAPALLLWSTTNILTGWSAGRFGLFGLKQKVPEHEMLNLVGLITILIGGICFAFIKKSILSTNKQVHVYPRRTCGQLTRKLTPMLQLQSSECAHSVLLLQTTPNGFIDRDQHLNPKTTASQSSGSHSYARKQKIFKQMRKWTMRNSHRLLCVLLALLSGFFYSATVMPVIYMQDNPEQFPDAPSSGLCYIFSHYFGIFLGSSTIFIIYAIIRRNKPTVNPTVILPSLTGGAIWGFGMVCLFLSNDLLTQTVTYPVLITIPGCVASLWSIYFFKEIELTRRNLCLISLSFTLIFVGAFLSFVSKSHITFDRYIPFFPASN